MTGRKGLAEAGQLTPSPWGNFNYNPQVYSIQEYDPKVEIYWKDLGNERQVFRTLFSIHRPLALKGPTGTGKTTFTRKMHQELGAELGKEKFTPQYVFDEKSGLYVKDKDKDEKEAGENKRAPFFPLYIIDGTEDTEAVHILGGYNTEGKFIGGPMYHWAHTGGILLVNEIAELRGDVQTIFHSPLDKERTVWIPDLARLVKLPDHAMLVAAYNPGYQTKRRALKISTKQRLPALDFTYPAVDVEAEIVYHASKIGEQEVEIEIAKKLAALANRIRSEDKEKSILASREGVSTRLLVMAAEMIAAGTSTADACRAAIISPLSNSDKEAEALEAIVTMCGL
ncbi:CbbQ/NirQ/NorQ/GpvN family protein [Candidatus Woesearchaeota archaeon]|nr:CbbQ/NirQ/NorQ/GpvN family protein [Candidatus Woesearchaeota archaeon]